MPPRAAKPGGSTRLDQEMIFDDEEQNKKTDRLQAVPGFTQKEALVRD